MTNGIKKMDYPNKTRIDERKMDDGLSKEALIEVQKIVNKQIEEIAIFKKDVDTRLNEINQLLLTMKFNLSLKSLVIGIIGSAMPIIMYVVLEML